MKKGLWAGAFAAAMALQTVAAGSAVMAEESEYKTTYGEKQFDDVTITVEVFDRSNAPEGESVVDNKWTQYINEKMNEVGITVEFVAVPRSEEVQKVQTMMASGSAPDLMLCYTTAVVEDFYNKGGTINLSEYVDGEDQAKNLKAYIGEECLNVGRNADGELWSIPARRSTTARTNIFLRKDWLDALEMEVPTTVDEMYDMLYAFKYNNPDGRDDVIASSFWTGDAGPMAFAFLDCVKDPVEFDILAGDSSMLVYGDEGMGEYLKWLNKLYNDGLMDSEYYTHNDFNQTLKERIVAGQQGSCEIDVNFSVDSLRGALLQNLQKNEPDADIISMEPVKHVDDGEVYNNGYPINGAYLFIPQTCKNPEAVVTYLDWLSTEEGGFVLFHGFEGVNYDLVDGVPVVKDADFNATDKDWTRHDLFLVGNQGYYATPEDFAAATSKETPGYEQYVLDNYENAGKGIVRNAPTFSGDLFTDANTDITLVKDEYFVKCITCAPEEFDATLEEFKEKLGDLGMEEIIEQRREHYAGN